MISFSKSLKKYTPGLVGICLIWFFLIEVISAFRILMEFIYVQTI
ncbi:hypothetical protein MGWOODY_Mmi132 [hydrothermal vent metagenome]|uniref:Uncharacterized protein n=1 Tax=hydrothermal vent metagenome TaxID=652676 RepID=A0A160VGR4_9ZZZZ